MNIKIARQPNLGASAARNHAFRLSKGEYIQWLDADDILNFNKIEQQMKHVKLLKDRRILFSSPVGQFYKFPEKAKFRENVLYQDLESVDWVIKKFRYNSWIGIQGWLVSRDICEIVGPWNENLTRDDDGEYFTRIVLASKSVRHVPTPNSYYRIGNQNSLSMSSSDADLESLFMSIKLSIEHLISKVDDENTRSASFMYIQNRIHSFYPNRLDIIEELKSIAGVLNMGKINCSELESNKAKLLKSIAGARGNERIKKVVFDIKTKIAKVREFYSL